jgi:perosamine synthetase
MVGAISELTAFSFYATKSITTGEGGMLTTDNDDYAERATMMRLHGIGRDAWKRYSKAGSWRYEVLAAGFKLNLTDVLAAIGLAQLQKCDRFWQQRQAIADSYRRLLGEIEELEMPPLPSQGSRHAWHLFILRLRPDCLGINRDQFIEELKKRNIGTSVHFIPLHRHPYYERQYASSPGSFPRAEDAYSRCLSLPIFPDLGEDRVRCIADAISDVVARNRKRKSVAV